MRKDPTDVVGLRVAAYVIDAVIITVLMFIFVVWFMLPRVGNTAYLWAGGFALGILGYFVVSYYLLRRQ